MDTPLSGKEVSGSKKLNKPQGDASQRNANNCC